MKVWSLRVGRLATTNRNKNREGRARLGGNDRSTVKFKFIFEIVRYNQQVTGSVKLDLGGEVRTGHTEVEAACTSLLSKP